MRIVCGVALAVLGLVAPVYSQAESLPLFTVEPVTMPIEYQVDGVVEARQQATLSAEVGGKIESVNFDVDDVVEKGAVVIRIRDLEYRSRQQKARAALAEAEAGLVEVKLRHKRSEDLLKQKLVAQSAYDEVSATLKASEAAVASARAELAQSEERLALTTVRAPYSGVVVQRHVEPGESILPGQPIMTGYAPGQLRVSASVPQSIIGNLRQQAAVRVLILEDGRSLAVEKVTIHPYASPENHGFPVRLDLSEEQGQLFPGMLVKVAIAVGEVDRLLVPAQALVSRSEVNAVYLRLADGRIALRQVRPGNPYGGRVEILAGLDAGEIVVLDPIAAVAEMKNQQVASQ